MNVVGADVEGPQCPVAFLTRVTNPALNRRSLSGMETVLDDALQIVGAACSVVAVACHKCYVVDPLNHDCHHEARYHRRETLLGRQGVCGGR